MVSWGFWVMVGGMGQFNTHRAGGGVDLVLAGGMFVGFIVQVEVACKHANKGQQRQQGE